MFTYAWSNFGSQCVDRLFAIVHNQRFAGLGVALGDFLANLLKFTNFILNHESAKYSKQHRQSKRYYLFCVLVYTVLTLEAQVRSLSSFSSFSM